MTLVHGDSDRSISFSTHSEQQVLDVSLEAWGGDGWKRLEKGRGGGRRKGEGEVGIGWGEGKPKWAVVAPCTFSSVPPSSIRIAQLGLADAQVANPSRWTLSSILHYLTVLSMRISRSTVNLPGSKETPGHNGNLAGQTNHDENSDT
ncbi:hypothetical protein An09g04760 [Aspergillus niger]|uniref:Uncharacterized protein n=2 Tax=Aspergillus niger TaxID=5061 RepID=A2QU87_ASPNC|nr:hypothetical protein An09g04760 [Aspergillus niger]CAK40330.1 hypothetical protein An09g04760 [Aspergillus niger]